MRLGADAEDGVDELALRDSVALSDPADLTFSDCVHCFVAGDRSAGAVHRPKSQARSDSLLDESMVLLDDVIEVLSRPAATASTKFTGLLQFDDRTGVRRMAIDVDYARTRCAAVTPASRKASPQ